MTTSSILDDVYRALVQTKRSGEPWPDHMVARAAVLSADAGRVVECAVTVKYAGGTPEEALNQVLDLRRAAVAGCANYLRFLQDLEKEGWL